MSRPGVRRVLHAASAGLLLCVPLWSWSIFRTVATVTACAAVALEAVRLASPAVSDAMARVVPVYRPTERGRPSGAMWLAVGFLLAAWFPPRLPALALLVGALADPAASYAGERWGNRSARKTVVGSLAFFVVAWAIALAVGTLWYKGVVIAAVGAALERWSGPLDDNLLVAPGTALSAWILG